LLVNGYASRSGFIGNSSFPTQRENSYQSYTFLYTKINALNRQRIYITDRCMGMLRLYRKRNSRARCSLYDPTVEYIRELSDSLVETQEFTVELASVSWQLASKTQAASGYQGRLIREMD
jgi:hypothetical protein